MNVFYSQVHVLCIAADRCRYLDSLHGDVPPGSFHNILISLAIETKAALSVQFNDIGWNERVAHLCIKSFPKQVRCQYIMHKPAVHFPFSVRFPFFGYRYVNPHVLLWP